MISALQHSGRVRTRFAPSPTGTLHLGNIRTALFAWAFARRHGGQFILRIEDTDLERSSEESAQGILRDLAWLGLDFDEGPYFQMQRLPRYREVIAKLLEEGKAYHCYMSMEELDALREAQRARGEKPRYDGRWRPENRKRLGLTPPPGVEPVIRFRNPDEGGVAWDDLVKGRIEIANAEMDDLVIARAAPEGEIGVPTYNFCVVVDDLDMAITHVLRGDGHVMNTPRQINIFRALGAEPPLYGHLPTVLGPDGEKLSKRHGATGLDEYRAAGYLPEAIINGLARLGWSHGNDEVFTPQEFVAWFNLESLTPSPARFDAEKFEWLNGEHIKRLPLEELARRLEPFLRQRGFGPEPSALVVGELFRERAPTLAKMAEQARYLFEPPEVSQALIEAHITPANRAALEEVRAALARIDWSREAIAALLKDTAKRHGLKPPQVMMPLRVLLTGTTQAPSVDQLIHAIGRAGVLARLAW
ncbi:MAG: glutamate--tRNA ligase [Casimicrobiaceae bacterium]|nr:glutamate--tRNA ligase [Casimicrobiaceae bacterium]